MFCRIHGALLMPYRHGWRFPIELVVAKQQWHLCMWQGPDECGPACDCLPECCNRERQQGLTIPVTLRLGEKGWAAYAGANLAAGQFVCLYVGDQLTSRAADARLAAYDAIPGGANHALLASLPAKPKLYVGVWILADGAAWTDRLSSPLIPHVQVVREHLHTGSCLRLNIDATHRGNVARFFNHACDGGVLNVEVSRQRSLHLVAQLASGQTCTHTQWIRGDMCRAQFGDLNIVRMM